MNTLRFAPLLLPLLLAADWPQYRGPDRNDISAETGLLQSWPKEGPTLLWTYANVGVGYSSFAVVDGKLYTVGGRGDDEFLIALDLKNIKDGAPAEAWSLKVGPLFTFKSNRWSAGPSSTPTVDGNLVYGMGGNGDLVCVDTAGKEQWRKNLPKDLDASINPIGGGPKGLGWGFTWSPLIDGDRLICAPGGPKGTMAALNKKTGEVIWRSAEVTDQAAYTSPMPMTVDGVKQFVLLTNQGLFAVDADGKLLWRHKRMPAYGTEVCNSAMVKGSAIFTTVGAGQGCEMTRIERDGPAFKAISVYNNKNLMNHHGDVIWLRDHIYGFSEGKGWMCLDAQKGEIVWTEKQKLRAGSITFADGRFYCFGEDDGTTVLVEPSTESWKEHGRFKIPQLTKLRQPNGRIWTPPVVADGKLFLRDQELLFCFDVKGK